MREDKRVSRRGGSGLQQEKSKCRAKSSHLLEKQLQECNKICEKSESYHDVHYLGTHSGTVSIQA